MKSVMLIWGAILLLLMMVMGGCVGEIAIPGLGQEEQVEFDEAKYPYLAKLPLELEGKIEARYNFEIGVVWGAPISSGRKLIPQRIPGEGILWDGVIKNISNETISYSSLEAQWWIKDVNTGEILDSGKGGQGGGILKPGQVIPIGGGVDFSPKTLSEISPNPQSLFVEVEIELVE